MYLACNCRVQFEVEIEFLNRSRGFAEECLAAEEVESVQHGKLAQMEIPAFYFASFGTWGSGKGGGRAASRYLLCLLTRDF